VKHAKKPHNRFVKLHPSVALAMRLLLLTGCRLREILHLCWDEVDFERGLLLLPDSKTGRKTVILNAPALALLSDAPRLGVYVIAGDKAGAKDEKPRSDLKKPWAAVTKRAKLDNLRIHDLRHSFASFGAGGGMGLPIIGKLLGHTQAATTARYAHLDADPLRRASNAIGNSIAAAMGEPVTPAEVIPFNGKQAGSKS
jgi:integrase